MCPDNGKLGLTSGGISDSLMISGKADIMGARCFPAAVLVIATLLLSARFAAPVAAQETSTPSPAPGAPALDQVQVKVFSLVYQFENQGRVGKLIKI